MPEVVTKKLGTFIGAEVPDVDHDRLLADDDLPQACLDALEEHNVLLFRELDIDDETQAAFCRKLGKLVRFPHYSTPEVMEISFDPDNPNAEYFASNDDWHIDGLCPVRDHSRVNQPNWQQAAIPRSEVPRWTSPGDTPLLFWSIVIRCGTLLHYARAVTSCQNYRILRFVRLRETHAIRPA